MEQSCSHLSWQVQGPTTWTILQRDGPNHLGLWCNALPARQTALITSGCDGRRSRSSCSSRALPGEASFPPFAWCFFTALSFAAAVRPCFSLRRCCNLLAPSLKIEGGRGGLRPARRLSASFSAATVGRRTTAGVSGAVRPMNKCRCLSGPLRSSGRPATERPRGEHAS